MSNEYAILVMTAASVGFLHTLLGPDHYLPFIVMAQARRWSFLKTGWITFLCGVGHVGSSVLLGIMGFHMIPLRKVERYSHALAGGAICLCGLAIQFLGL